LGLKDSIIFISCNNRFIKMAFIIYILLGFFPIAYYLLPYLTDSKKLRRFPAPFPGAFSDFWLFWQARKRKRHFAVHDLHKKYGKFVRVQPNHVSIADPAAIPIIYGHGTGFLKSYVLLAASL